MISGEIPFNFLSNSTQDTVNLCDELKQNYPTQKVT